MSLLALAAAVVSAGQTFTCTPTHVYDGDGPIWCAEGPHVRVAGIAAREMDGTCRDNQPCPAASAIQARDALIDLFGGARGAISTGHVIVRGPTMPAFPTALQAELALLPGARFPLARISPAR